MEKTIDYYNQVAPYYDEHFKRAIDLAENQYVFEKVSNLVNGNSVIDLGCGTGLLLEYCQPAKYLGVDIADQMLQQAIHKNGHNGTFMCVDMACLDAPGEWDVIVSTFGSFSFSLEPASVVDTICRSLGPDGRFFIMAYGPRYASRSHHISPDLEVVMYEVDRLIDLFSCFHDVKVYGVNALPDWLNLPQPVLYHLLHLEARTIGKWFPTWCYFLVIEGSK